MAQARSILSLMDSLNWRHSILLTAKDPYSVGLSYDLVTQSKGYGMKINQLFFDRFTPDLFKRVKEIGYKVIIVVGTTYILPDSVGDLTSENGYTWIFAEYIGAVNKNVGFPKVYHNSLVAKTPFLNSAELLEFKEAAEEIEDLLPEMCKPYSVFSNFYTPHIVDAYNAYFNSAHRCLYQHGDLCTNQLIIEDLRSSSIDGLGGVIHLNESLGSEMYEIHKIDEPDTLPFFIWSESVINVDEYCEKLDNEDKEECKDSAVYKELNDAHIIHNMAIWPGIGKRVPTDGSFVYVLGLDENVSVASIVIGFFFLILVSMSICFIIKHAESKYIEDSGLLFNIMVLLGVGLLSIYLIISVGVPSVALCNLRIWTGYLGFCMTLIPFIIKSRKYRRHHKKVDSVLTYSYFIKLYALIIGPIILVLILWSSISTPNIQSEELNGVINLSCEGGTPFTYIALGYSALLVLVNLVFAIQIDKERVKEAKWIQLIAYIIFLNSLLGLSIGYLIIGSLISAKNMFATHITMISFMGLGMMASTLCLVGPKALSILESHFPKKENTQTMNQGW